MTNANFCVILVLLFSPIWIVLACNSLLDLPCSELVVFVIALQVNSFVLVGPNTTVSDRVNTPVLTDLSCLAMGKHIENILSGNELWATL